MQVFNSCRECIERLGILLDAEGIESNTPTTSGLEENRRCLEVFGWCFRLIDWNDRDEVTLGLGESNYRFLKQEFLDWLDYAPNPGRAWLEDPNEWERFLDSSGRMTYTYPERFSKGNQLGSVIELLRTQPDTRQAFVGIWAYDKDLSLASQGLRVPCTIGYHFRRCGPRLNLLYSMRSLCVDWNLANDLWLSTHLLEHVSESVDLIPGILTMSVGCLHKFLGPISK